jgi:hypothetical protein
MIRFVLSALLLSFGALALPAQAGTGGLSGYLLDPSGNPLANVDLWYDGPLRTDRHGFFTILRLQPGLYSPPNRFGEDIYSTGDCPLIPVLDGEITFVRITMQLGTFFCTNLTVLPSGLLDPNQGGDLYRI